MHVWACIDFVGEYCLDGNGICYKITTQPNMDTKHGLNPIESISPIPCKSCGDINVVRFTRIKGMVKDSIRKSAYFFRFYDRCRCGKMWMYEEAKVKKDDPEYESWFYKSPGTDK